MLNDAWENRSKYPRTDTPLFSQYSREEICACLDRWYAIEEQLEAIYPRIPDNSPLWEKINALEEIHFSDVTRMRATRTGSQELYPVQKWNTLIKKWERLLAILQKEVQ